MLPVSELTTPFIQWRGFWGNSDSSPEAPRQQGAKWDDPSSWILEPDIEQCSTSAAARATSSGRKRTPKVHAARKAGRRPAAPDVRVRRKGRWATVSYRFAHGPKRTKRKYLFVSLHRRGRVGAIRSRGYTIRSRSGRLRILIGRSRRPFRVKVSVFARSGMRSRIVVSKLKR